MWVETQKNATPERGDTAMLTIQEPTRAPERAAQEFTPPEAWIARDVLIRLGRPLGLHRVQVRQVAGRKYRVNVYVRAGAASYRIAHSYFLEADGEGKVLSSSPEITRTY